jgi:hypothetical protein
VPPVGEACKLETTVEAGDTTLSAPDEPMQERDKGAPPVRLYSESASMHAGCRTGLEQVWNQFSEEFGS